MIARQFMSKSFLPPDWQKRIEQYSRTPRPRWVRIAAWIWFGFTAAGILATFVLAMLVNNPQFHAYLIRKAEASASDSLGVRVRLENFALHLDRLSVDLYGLTIDGASPYPNPPVLQIDHAEASVRVVSILHKAWYFDNFRIDHPVARIFIDDHGISNIPTLKSSNSSSGGPTIFDLGIRHALLDRGQVLVNDRPSTLSADLHDLDFHASFNSFLEKYSGTLVYSSGNFVYGNLRPLTHNLEVHFNATPNTFELTQGRLTMGNSQALLAATVRDYAHPNVQGRYDISADGAQLAHLIANPSVPSGVIRATGTVEYQPVANQALLEDIRIDGDLASSHLEVKQPSLRGALDRLTAHYSLANGDAVLRDLKASLLGGEITAQGAMRNIGGNSHSDFHGALRGVSLSQARRAAGASASASNIALEGDLNATVAVNWGKTLGDLVAHADGTVHGQAHGNVKPQVPTSAANSAGLRNTINSSPAIPLESEFHATYHANDSQLALSNSYLRTQQTDLTMNGVISTRSNLSLQLHAGDLREIEQIADAFLPADQGRPMPSFGLAGSASFQGALQGSIKAPHLTGQLNASDLKLNGTDWKRLRTDVDLSPSMVNLQHAELDPASQGRISFSASASLLNWTLTKSSPVSITAEVSDLNVADLSKLANQTIPVSGILNAGISLHGTKLNPVGNGTITLTKMVAYEQPMNSVKLTFSGDGDQAHGDLAVQLPSGSIQVKASVHPGERTYNATLTASGIHLDKLQALKARDVNLTGVVSLDAKGQGSFDNPQFDATVKIPILAVQSQKITGIALQAAVANHLVNANLTSSAANTSIQAKARINLTGDYLADASLDTASIPLQPLLAAYASGQAENISGQAEVHATLHGPLKNKSLLEAHVTIPVFKAAYSDSIQMAATSPIRVDYKNGVVDIRPSSIKGTDTDLQFQGSIPTTGNGPMSLKLLGTVNLELAQLFDPDVRSSGQLRFRIDSNGPANAADLGGQVEIVDANFASADLPVGLQHGKGVLTLTKDRLNISSFTGQVGGGTVTAQGGIAYRPGIQFDLGLAANNIRILYPEGMRENIDANLRLSGTTENAQLGGSVNLADLSFTPAFDLTSFINQFSGGVSAPPSQGISQNMQLNIAVHSTSDVNLISSTLSIGGSANLQVRGTAAEPVIVGRVNLNSGDIILNGNRFVLNGGTIQFVNPSETEPVVNLALNTSIQQYSINLRFRGPVDRLQTDYSSDPALPSADIINLLAFGQTTEASAQNATPANQAAESLIASQVSNQLTGRLSKVAGISQLSISPVLAGSSSQGPAGATITIQQRVTGNIFVNYSTNVASTQSQTIQGQYQISPRVSLSATRDPNGGFGFDTLIKKSW
jgi:translocation and assembly module TamB